MISQPQRSSIRVVAIAACVFAITATSVDGQTAQPRLEYQVTTDDDAHQATFQFEIATSVDDVTVELQRPDGQRHVESVGDLAAGEQAQVTFEHPPKTLEYDVAVDGHIDGDEFSLALDVEITVGEPLTVELMRDKVDLDEGVAPVRTNQPVERMELTITDDDGNSLVEESSNLGGREGQFDVQWDTDADAIGEVTIKFYDSRGSWSRYNLRPIEIELPQQVINFETGSATLDSDGKAKLATTRQRIDEAMDKLGEHRSELSLYVAGYTDTVGPADQNLALSERRARSIAQWFRNQGLDIPVFYQGFGQEVLAVDTPDETEERQNRRAVYILANTPPTSSQDIPRSDWKTLP